MKNKKISNIILKLYALDNSIVNDDKRLIAQVWYEYGWLDSDTLEDNLAKVPNPETITRSRRKLYTDGLIKYSEDAANRRYDEWVEYKHSYGEPVIIF